MTARTPTLDDLVADATARRDAAARRRRAAQEARGRILATAQAERREQLTAEEFTAFDQLTAQHDQARRDYDAARSEVRRLAAIQAEEDAYQRRAAEIRPAAPGVPADRAGGVAYDRAARIGYEARTYHRGNDPAGRQFLMDVCRAMTLHDPDAVSRLARHMTEERAERQTAYFERAAGDTTTANWAGLTVPQYLTDMYAPVARALRPFADVCNQHPLPAEGMALDISRITTGTSVAPQANELDAVSATSADDTLLTIPVLTAAGQQKVSRQAIDRGRGLEDVLMQDLFRAYATSLDSQLISTASTGLSAVATATTYDDTQPTVAKLYPKIMGAMAGVEAALLNMGSPSHAVMHSRRWYWLASAMTSTWPFINAGGIPTQAAGTADPASAYAKGVRGVLPIGLQVVVDNNIPTSLGAGTNQDEIYVVPDVECHLWEDPNAPVYIRADQPAAPNLGVLLVVYGYFAFTLSRYTGGMAKVSGTSLVTPSW
jgi:HK97 family phage major capsid protein